MDKLLDFFDDEALSEKELIEWKKKVSHPSYYHVVAPFKATLELCFGVLCFAFGVVVVE